MKHLLFSIETTPKRIIFIQKVSNTYYYSMPKTDWVDIISRQGQKKITR